MRPKLHTQIRTSGVLFLLFFLINSSVFSQVVRKNIDSLTPVELATYEHAIQLLRDRSTDNPYDLEGYAWQAWVHNKNRVSVPKTNTLKQGSMSPTQFYQMAATQTYPDGTYGYPGMCEHGKDIFFVWHRAQFYYFETILQNTDPDGTIPDSKGNKYPTKNLAVPFWNFTKSPSGTKFPRAYEDRSSVLYHAGRNTRVNPRDTIFTSPYLLSRLLQESDWSTFGGYVDATNGGYGTLESQMHNPMHTPYIGGDMASPSRAAYDPIFYSFHSYIDYIFEAWIQKHGDQNLTSTGYFLRAQQPKKYNLPGYDPGLGDRPNMGRANLYFDTKKLGYIYEAGPGDQFYTQEEIDAFLTDDRGKPLVFGESSESPYYKLFTDGVSRRPEPIAEKVTTQALNMKELAQNNYVYTYVDQQASSSYQIDIYIHPKKVKADIPSEKFREKYFVSSATAWLDSSHAHHMSTDHKLNVNLSDVIKDLKKNFPKKKFQLTVNYIKR